MTSARHRTVGAPNIGSDALPLKLGSRGTNVHQAQRSLQTRGYTLRASGIYSAETEGVVKTYQKNHYLTVTGTVPSATWNSLFPTLRAGSTQQEAIKALQNVLRRWGYVSVTVTGTFGSATTAAVKNFQSHHYLTVNGVVGGPTWKALYA